MDMKVGVWKGWWPNSITCLICVDDNLLVRYHREDCRLDLTRVTGTSLQGEVLSVVELPSSEYPYLHSLHHFSAAVDPSNLEVFTPYVMCITEDKCTFMIVRIHEDKLTLEATGQLPFAATHTVIFKYRGFMYALCYSTTGGDFAVFSMNMLVRDGDAQKAIETKGKFRPGWTNVVWKGTHHVRCTRQKFFCYNSNTGEVSFECVYVRSAISTASSICSAEHVAMSVHSGEGEVGTAELETTLKKKHCIVVPLTIQGRTSCLLYTHSAFNDHSVRLQKAQSTDRLRVGQAKTQQPAQSSVLQSSMLMLQKKVFLYHDPWTHFCVVMEDEAGVNLLCYSAVTGATWLSTIFPSEAPVKEITLMDDQPQHGPESEQQKANNAYLSSSAIRALGDESHRAWIENYISRTQHPTPQPPASASGASEQHSGRRGHRALKDAKATPEKKTPLKRKDSVKSKQLPVQVVGQRPPTSSLSLRDRLSEIPSASAESPEGYKAAIASILERIQVNDFGDGEMEYVQAALAHLDDTLPAVESAVASPRKHPSSASSRRWVTVTGMKDREPAPEGSGLRMFEDKIAQRRPQDPPQERIDVEKSVARLFSQGGKRDEFQKKQLEKIDAEVQKNRVGASVHMSPRSLSGLVKRLNYEDVAIRKKKQEGIQQKYQFHPPEAPVLSEADLEGHIQRINTDSINHKKQAIEKAAKRMQPVQPKASKPLSHAERDTLSKRLIDGFIQKREEHLRLVMDEVCVDVKGKKMTDEELKASAQRLCKHASER